jgi:hypothetical protein
LSFFSPADDREPELTPPHPPWLEPPRNEIGFAVPARLLLAQNDQVAVGLVNLVAYSTGVAFELALRAAPGHAFGHEVLLGLGGFWQLAPGQIGDDQIVRFGVEFADGRRVLDMGAEPEGGDGPPAICLVPHGGGGGGGAVYEFGYWLYPLPPSGPVTFAVEWPAEGIPSTKRVLDASVIIDAGARATRLWNDPGGEP